MAEPLGASPGISVRRTRNEALCTQSGAAKACRTEQTAHSKPAVGRLFLLAVQAGKGKYESWKPVGTQRISSI